MTRCECDEDFICEACEPEVQAEMERLWKLYRAERRAGLRKAPWEIDRDLEDAGRGHLLPPERRTMPTRRTW